MGRDPVARARQLLDAGSQPNTAQLEAALAGQDLFPRWAAAVALLRVQRTAAPERALEVLADAYVADPPETRTVEAAYHLFNDHFVDPVHAGLDPRQAKTVTARLLTHLDDLDPIAIARGERTRAVRVLETILRLTFAPKERVRAAAELGDWERIVLTTLATHRDAERWWRICWPPVWWYFGLPDNAADTLLLLGRARTSKNRAAPERRVGISRDEYWRQISQLKTGERNDPSDQGETVLRLGVALQDHYLYALSPPACPDQLPVDANLFATPNTFVEQAGGEELFIAIIPEAPGYLYQLKGQDIVRNAMKR